ncbi:hypothetical protein H4R27_004709 [Coemansia aciculifera]|nr:hypothetical protein H4R27_004709 [Coemansia aciculifera]
MGKDYNGIGGGKYKSSNSKKGASKRAVEVTPQSSLEEMKLVVRVSKKASDSGAEYHFTFDLEELEIDIETAKLSKLFNKDDIYERDYVVQTCFTNSKYQDSDDEEEDEDEDEDDDEESAEAEDKEGDDDVEKIEGETGEVKVKEALDDWVEVTKEVDAIGKKAEEASESEDKEEDEDEEEDEESEEEDDNPYRLIFQDEDGEYEDIDGDVLIKDLLEGGEVIITLK